MIEHTKIRDRIAGCIEAAYRHGYGRGAAEEDANEFEPNSAAAKYMLKLPKPTSDVLALLAPIGEPVAWAPTFVNGELRGHGDEILCFRTELRARGYTLRGDVAPLYASPPVQEPTRREGDTLHGWQAHRNVTHDCVECPGCGIIMPAEYEDTDGSGYTCTNCPGQEPEVEKLRARDWRDVMDLRQIANEQDCDGMPKTADILNRVARRLASRTPHAHKSDGRGVLLDTCSLCGLDIGNGIHARAALADTEGK